MLCGEVGQHERDIYITMCATVHEHAAWGKMDTEKADTSQKDNMLNT